MESIEFLQQWPKPWALAAIPVEGGAPVVRSFVREEDVLPWLNGLREHNFYFHVNPCCEGLAKKARKSDVVGVWCAHVDVDPRPGLPLEDERDRILRLLEGCTPMPSVCVDSGGGFQAFWLYTDRLDPLGDGETVNKLIAKRLGGDSCHNIDRLMRLPGTVNKPDAKKRKAGREARRARIVWAHWDQKYTPEDFLGEAEDPLDCLTTRVQDLIRLGLDADYDGRYPSRSEMVMGVVVAMVEAGLPDDLIIATITDPKKKISAHVLDQKQSDLYARRQCDQARKLIEERESDFERSEPDGEEMSFLTNKDGVVVPQLYHNAKVALHRLGVEVTYNQFTEQVLIDGEPLTDEKRVFLWVRIQERFNFMPTKAHFHEYIVNLGRERPFHPVRAYLQGLRWDGENRIDFWLRDYLGIEDSRYSRAVGRIFLIAAVNRIFRPGCKFDEMLILEGIQGADKSSLIEALCVCEEWFHDNVPFTNTKEFLEITLGKWILEVAELSNIRRAHVDELKRVLSSRTDRARLAYGRCITDRPRQCVFIGTTNEKQYLKDTTGNRRFWPVRIGQTNIEGLRNVRDQLWAEAVHRKDESIRLDKKLWKEAGIQQERRVERHPWHDRLEAEFDNRTGRLLMTEVYDILRLGPDRNKQSDGTVIRDIMGQLGFTKEKMRVPGYKNPQWCFWRGSRKTAMSLRSEF